MSDKAISMRQLVDLLLAAAQKYYNGTDEPIFTDAEYDRYMRQLCVLEHELGYRYPDSPTINAGFEEDGDKMKHHMPVLSLKDTKDLDELLRFLGGKEGVLSWKLDGMSVVLYYQNGQLVRALSRGDGRMGKDITKNVVSMRNVPLTIKEPGTAIVRGEGVCSIKEFEQLKRTKQGEKYRNPRNMAAGLLNATKTTNILLKHLSFVAHTVYVLESKEGIYTKYTEQLSYLQKLGFTVVPHDIVWNYTLKNHIEGKTRDVQTYEYPVDGLVLAHNDIQYGRSLGRTAKWPKHSIAFKWPDVSALTTVIGMKWSVSRTGLITPVVLLKPIFLEGTEVSQANLHSLKIFQELQIGLGDTVEIFKANKIINEIKDNMTRSGTLDYPRRCPRCQAKTVIETTELTRKLYCGDRCTGDQFTIADF